MSTSTAAEKYRQNAADCLRLAQVVSTSGDKLLLTQMASMWLRLVESAEKNRTAAAPDDGRTGGGSSDDGAR